jgi:hypothetical protein
MKDKLDKIGKIVQLKTQWGFTVKVEITDFKVSDGKSR